MGRANSELTPERNFFLETRLKQLLKKTPYSTRMKLKALYSCSDVPIINRGEVDIIKRTSAAGTISAHFCGVQYCGSSWSCPHCTPRNLKRHSLKIDAIISHYAKQGIKAYMITFTIPHNMETSAAICLARLKRTYQAVSRSGAGNRLLQKIRHIGKIVTTECTYSTFRGFHFHLHILHFLKPGGEKFFLEYAKKISEYAKRFYNKSHIFKDGAIQKDAAKDMAYVSVDSHGKPRAIHSGDYICGYGLSEKSGGAEMSKATNKSKKSAQMFDLLESDNPRDQEAFLEYALATKGYVRISYTNRLADGVDVEAYIREVEAKRQKDGSKKNGTTSTELVCSFTSSSWIEICTDAKERGVNHKWNFYKIIIDGGGFKEIDAYCYYQKIPRPLPLFKKIACCA